MRAQYAVQFDFGAAGAGDFDDAKADVFRWAQRNVSASVEDLSSSAGQSSLEGGRRIAWESFASPSGRAKFWRMDVSDRPLVGTSDFASSSTLTSLDGRVHFSLQMGPRSLVNAISPPGALPYFNRPKIVKDLVSKFATSSGSVPLMPEPRSASVSEIQELIDLLEDHQRLLPVVVIASRDRDDQQRRLADVAADRLVGLAHVWVLETWLAYQVFNERVEHLLPPRGARLYWPGIEATDAHRWWTAGSLRDSYVWAKDVLETLAELSVLANAVDRSVAEVRKVARLERAEAARRELTEAADVASLEEQLRLTRRALDAEKELSAQLAVEFDELEAEKLALESEQAQLRSKMMWLTSEHKVDEPAPVDDYPSSIDELWKSLETKANGSLIFTTNARRVWKNSGYLHVGRMRGALIALCEASIEWAKNPGGFSNLAEWIETGYGLELAWSDADLKKNHFECDEQFCRVRHVGIPHIKVDDSKAPNECGRIYFAIEGKPSKVHKKPVWIVDWVGTHP